MVVKIVSSSIELKWRSYFISLLLCSELELFRQKHVIVGLPFHHLGCGLARYQVYGKYHHHLSFHEILGTLQENEVGLLLP